MTYSDLNLIGKIVFRAMAATTGSLCRLIKYVYAQRKSREPKF